MIDLELYTGLPAQGTDEWHKLRMGNFNASRISELMGSGKKKDEYWSKTALSYINEVAAERNVAKDVLESDDLFWIYLNLTNTENKYMRWGSEHEFEAREIYADKHGVEVTEVSSIKHPYISHFACSSDGLVKATNSGIEIKCPLPKTYWEWRQNVKDAKSLKAIKPEYYWQIMAQIEICDLDYVDFIAYCPLMEKPIYEVRIEHNGDDIAAMVERVKKADLIADGIVVEDLRLTTTEE